MTNESQINVYYPLFSEVKALKKTSRFHKANSYPTVRSVNKWVKNKGCMVLAISFTVDIIVGEALQSSQFEKESGIFQIMGCYRRWHQVQGQSLETWFFTFWIVFDVFWTSTTVRTRLVTNTQICGGQTFCVCTLGFKSVKRALLWARQQAYIYAQPILPENNILKLYDT